MPCLQAMTDASHWKSTLEKMVMTGGWFTHGIVAHLTVDWIRYFFFLDVLISLHVVMDSLADSTLWTHWNDPNHCIFRRAWDVHARIKAFTPTQIYPYVEIRPSIPNQSVAAKNWDEFSMMHFPSNAHASRLNPRRDHSVEGIETHFTDVQWIALRDILQETVNFTASVGFSRKMSL